MFPAVCVHVHVPGCVCVREPERARRERGRAAGEQEGGGRELEGGGEGKNGKKMGAFSFRCESSCSRMLFLP